MILKDTTDVWFVAFLMHKGYKISKYDVITKGKVKCYFDISDSNWKELKLEFNNSDLSQFKSLIDKVKDLSY